jgi:hypothetical protein
MSELVYCNSCWKHIGKPIFAWGRRFENCACETPSPDDRDSVMKYSDVLSDFCEDTEQTHVKAVKNEKWSQISDKALKEMLKMLDIEGDDEDEE